MSLNRVLLLAILLYALITMASNLDFNSVSYDEAFNIETGRGALSGSLFRASGQYAGSSLLSPALFALGDSFGGLSGARAISILFGLGLILVIYLTTSTLYSPDLGLLAAIIALFMGTLTYISRLATNEIISAFFLGASFLFILLARKRERNLPAAGLLLAAALSLSLAVITKYIAGVFMPFLLFYVAFTEKSWRPFFFILPLAFLLGSYYYFAVLPIQDSVLEGLFNSFEGSHIPFSILLNWTIRWVLMSYLLSALGLFHEKWGGSVPALLLLSTPIIAIHLLTGAEQSVNRDVILSGVFLAPAAALGVDHLSNIFSLGTRSAWVKPFFTFAVLFVLWTFGLQELGWLEKQYPDFRPVINYFRKVASGSTALAATDSEHSKVLLDYALGPDCRTSFLPFTELRKNRAVRPDFLIIDDYYGNKSLRPEILAYMGQHYKRAREFEIKLSWGKEKVQIYSRR